MTLALQCSQVCIIHWSHKKAADFCFVHRFKTLMRCLTFMAFLAGSANPRSAGSGGRAITIAPTCRVKGRPKVELVLNCGDGKYEGEAGCCFYSDCPISFKKKHQETLKNCQCLTFCKLVKMCYFLIKKIIFQFIF